MKSKEKTSEKVQNILSLKMTHKLEVIVEWNIEKIQRKGKDMCCFKKFFSKHEFIKLI
jgi:hypothetical protein